VSTSVALAVLAELEKEDFNKRADEVAKYLHTTFKNFPSVSNLVGSTRARGFSLALELVAVDDANAPNQAAAQMLRQRLFDHGVVVDICGLNRNVVGLSPPFALTMEQAHTLVAAMKEALAEMEASMGRKKRKAASASTSLDSSEEKSQAGGERESPGKRPPSASSSKSHTEGSPPAKNQKSQN